MGAQVLERFGGGAASATAAGALDGQQVDSAVQADVEDLFNIRDIGVGAVVQDEGSVAAQPRLDRLAVLGVVADEAGQFKQANGLLQFERLGRPALGQGGATGLVAFCVGGGANGSAARRCSLTAAI